MALKWERIARRIDTSKSALLPGHTASASSFTGYNNGINGIMIDVAGLVGTPTASDFIFKVGTSADPSTWSTAPTPSAVSVRSGAGASGSDRIEVTWADGDITNEWLQVTLKADSMTGLAGADVFYIGNLIGDANGDGTVTTADATILSSEFSSTGDPITESADFNKDGSVDGTDALALGRNFNASIPLLTAPVQNRAYYTTSYYDQANRLTDQVNVGTNGGSSYTRPGSVPTGSDTVLVNHTDYDAAGNVADTIDPRGIHNDFTYDLLNRTLSEDDGASGPASSGESLTDYTYDANGDVLTMTAEFPGTMTNSQTTSYIYRVTGTALTNLFSNDLIQKVEYPDPSTGAASSSASNDVAYTYDLQGETLTKTDQNASTHTYTYDVLGRPTLDAVTTLGSGVDGSIQALGYSYNGLGLPYQQTSYSDAAATTVVNQVQDVYNGYGQLVTQYQEHSGSVNTGSSAKVQYAYSTGTNASRLTSMTYPNGRVLDYVYNSGLDSDVSRLSGMSDAAGTGAGSLESYTYLGLGTIVQRTDGDGIALSYIKQPGDTLAGSDGGDQYTGLDRFGRVDDQNWVNTSTGISTDRFQYGYDRDGNVLYKNNLVNSSFSELYHANSSTSGDNNTAYDNLNRIVGFRRGTLSSSTNNGTGLDTVTTLNSNADSSQSWTLDAVGNQTGVTTDGTPQSNTVNSQNELTGAGSNTLAFDNNGNTTTDDQGHTLIYDAWNKLVQVKNGGTTLATYAYDANGNRIQQNDGTPTDLFNSTAGQVLEERQSSTTTNQYVWSIAYINTTVERDDNSTSGSYGKSGSGLGIRIYAQEDANDNITALTNTSGVVQQRFDYTPYGVMAVLDGTTSWGTTTNLLSWVYTFQGGRYDAAVDLSHFTAREYSASLARWIQKDPSGYNQGSNVYEMELDNSSNLVDPTGLDSLGPGTKVPGTGEIAIPKTSVGNGSVTVWKGVTVDHNGGASKGGASFSDSMFAQFDAAGSCDCKWIQFITTNIPGNPKDALFGPMTRMGAGPNQQMWQQLGHTYLDNGANPNDPEPNGHGGTSDGNPSSKSYGDRPSDFGSNFQEIFDVYLVCQEGNTKNVRYHFQWEYSHNQNENSATMKHFKGDLPKVPLIDPKTNPSIFEGWDGDEPGAKPIYVPNPFK